MTDIVELNEEIWQIDLEDCGQPGRTAGYLVKGDDGWMLIETGPACSAEKILDATKTLGINSSEIKYVAVTHIHIDHAGGLGLISQHFKQAKVLVHPNGARHMVNPSRLIEGCTAVWGRKKMKEFGEILPVPETKVIQAREKQRIDLGNRVIEVWETPGHAKNHVCFYDYRTEGLFGGDIGVYQPQLSKILNRPVVRPATPIPDFHGEQMLNSLTKIAQRNVRIIYFTHFGPVGPPAHPIIYMIIGQLLIQLELGRKCLKQPDSKKVMSQEILQQILKRYNITDLDTRDTVVKGEWEYMAQLRDISAAGILNYLKKNEPYSLNLSKCK